MTQIYIHGKAMAGACREPFLTPSASAQDYSTEFASCLDLALALSSLAFRASVSQWGVTAAERGLAIAQHGS